MLPEWTLHAGRAFRAHGHGGASFSHGDHFFSPFAGLASFSGWLLVIGMAAVLVKYVSKRAAGPKINQRLQKIHCSVSHVLVIGAIIHGVLAILTAGTVLTVVSGVLCTGAIVSARGSFAKKRGIAHHRRASAVALGSLVVHIISHVH